jgi:Ala-tRNA(Pro) deacylase
MSIPASIEQFVALNGIPFTPIHHRVAFTAQEEAAATHVPGREWAKTVVCMADNKPVLAVLPAHYQVDLAALRTLTGCKHLRLATEQEFTGLYPECETGAMAPLGPLYNQTVYMDDGLRKDTEIVFHAGTHVDAIRMRLADFIRLVRPLTGRFSVPIHN